MKTITPKTAKIEFEPEEIIVLQQAREILDNLNTEIRDCREKGYNEIFYTALDYSNEEIEQLILDINDFSDGC